MEIEGSMSRECTNAPRNLKMEAGMYQQQMVMILRNHGSGFVLLGKFQGNRLKHLQGQLESFIVLVGRKETRRARRREGGGILAYTDTEPGEVWRRALHEHDDANRSCGGRFFTDGVAQRRPVLLLRRRCPEPEQEPARQDGRQLRRRGLRSALFLSGKAAKLLGPPTSFDAGKLTVEFAHSHGNSSSGFPRAYTLTHCDFTANLTLAVSDTIAADRRLRADDVFAEWKQQQQQEGMALHVHCFVSGANLLHGLAAGFRYYVFSKELPLVLKAVVHGDALLFAEQPELLEAKTTHKRHALEQLHNAITKGTRRRRRKWSSPDAIFSALLALLL
nr:OSJNBb0020J19.16 [Oryza sativa Japonica Group]